MEWRNVVGTPPGHVIRFEPGRYLSIVVDLEDWRTVAAEHEMRCGRCRGGMLRLVEIVYTITPYKPFQSVSVLLRCDNETCELEFEMPLHAREEGSAG